MRADRSRPAAAPEHAAARRPANPLGGRRRPSMQQPQHAQRAQAVSVSCLRALLLLGLSTLALAAEPMPSQPGTAASRTAPLAQAAGCEAAYLPTLTWAEPRLQGDPTRTQPLDDALASLLALKGLRILSAGSKAASASGFEPGFLPEDVRRVFPDWVQVREDGSSVVAPRGFEALTVEALRELQLDEVRRSSLLGERLQTLQRENASLRHRVERLEALLTAALEFSR